MELDRKPFTELLGSLHELLDAALAERVLKSIPALSSLTDSQREHAVKAFRTMSFAAGDTLATEVRPPLLHVPQCLRLARGVHVQMVCSGSIRGHHDRAEGRQRQRRDWRRHVLHAAPA